MVKRDAFCNKLNELKYRYKRETDRVALYKKPGNPDFIAVPRRDLLDEQYVRSTLSNAGCGFEEIERFIQQYKTQ